MLENVLRSELGRHQWGLETRVQIAGRVSVFCSCCSCWEKDRGSRVCPMKQSTKPKYCLLDKNEERYEIDVVPLKDNCPVLDLLLHHDVGQSRDKASGSRL
jgi:hypothetical protein